MQFNHDELMLMMLYNTGTRQGLVRELRLMQCYLMPDETALREMCIRDSSWPVPPCGQSFPGR